MKFGLPEKLIADMNFIFSRHSHIQKVLLYGSRALLRIQTELDDLMSPYKMDVSLFHEIDNSNLVEHIERFGKEFYNKNRA